MSIHKAIVLAANPRGMFLEGQIEGTPKPGIMCSVKANTAFILGRPVWVPYAGATGERDLVAILYNDYYQGRGIDEAYVTGDRCFLYVPYAGEEMKVLVKNITGTADAFQIGQKLIVETATGKFLITASTPESEPFKVYETVAALTADQLVHVCATGY